MADEVTFQRGPARRPTPHVADPIIQWATGLHTSDRRIYAGWLIPCGQSDALDEAAAMAGLEPVIIKHGGGNLVQHWSLPTADLFVAIDGVQTITEMSRGSERYGMAFAWRSLPDGRSQSVLRVRVFVRELMEQGYLAPLLLGVKSTQTSDLVGCLLSHYALLDQVDAWRAEQGKPPMQPPFYAAALRLGPGPEVQRGAAGQSREISPMEPKVPSPLTKAYVREVWVRREWVAVIEGMIDATVQWSVEESQRIAAGELEPFEVQA